MASQARIFRTDTYNPWYNLAVEEHLLDTLGADEAVLYVWQNDNTIVIGKNQNAWAECRPDALRRDGVVLARRISGGGAVFHDLGNLNFSLITSEDGYNPENQMRFIVRTLARLGLSAQVGGRNDISIDGRKFSGNAYTHRAGKVCHHGTILVSADLSRLSQYLNPPSDKIESKGIASVRQRVVNLCDIDASVSVGAVADALIACFIDEMDCPYTMLYDTSTLDCGEINRLCERNRSDEWLYAQNPAFDITLHERFAWGRADLCFCVSDAKVTGFTVYSDSLNAGFIDRLKCGIPIGAKFTSAHLCELIREVKIHDCSESQMRDDIERLIYGSAI